MPLAGVEIVERDGRLIASVAGERMFDDDLEHVHQALFRLMQVDERRGHEFIERACGLAARTGGPLWERDPDRAAVVLRDAWHAPDARVLPRPTHPQASRLAGREIPPEMVWADAIADAHDHVLVGCGSPFAHAWLVDRATGRRARPPVYEEEYFEGHVERVGYGSYAEQEGWRAEKSRRQVRQVQASLAFVGRDAAAPVRLLDVGCGYGYFRAAADEVGWEHDGLEVSRFAAAVAKDMYGFETTVGDLADLVATSSGAYDVIVMWDFLEHVEDPDAVLRTAADLLAPEGFLFVRTPNLLALERDVFGRDYHSLKLEHLHVFSPASLAAAASAAGLEPAVMVTESHLLRGFLASRLAELAVTQRGSDILFGARLR